ncbi:MAG: VWA domain-containing protein [Vicinamibacterales bacterium]
MFLGVDVSTVSFAEPLYLWLLAVPGGLLVLWIGQVLRRRLDTRRLGRHRVLPVGERHPLLGDLAFWVAVGLATVFCILALARPAARLSVLRRASADIVILQDGSASMHVTDVAQSRWRRSVQFLRAFGEALSWRGDRVALALFAHHAAPQVRLTKDPNALFFFIDHLGERPPFPIEDEPTWDTNIETGVSWGLQLVEMDEKLFGKTSNPKAFVVISDGQAWSGTVARAIADARARDILVYAVGVGTTAGGVIPDPLGRPPIRAGLDRASLAEMARAGGGQYFEIGREPDASVAAKIISSIRRRIPASQVDESTEELYWPLLFAAAVVLCLGTFTVRRRTELWWLAGGALLALLVLANTVR